MLSIPCTRKSTLADSACRTGISTSSALHAGICIDYVMIISLRNSTCWALAFACSIVISSFNLFSSLMGYDSILIYLAWDIKYKIINKIIIIRKAVFCEAFCVNKVHRKPENSGAKSFKCMISVHCAACNCEGTEQLHKILEL